MVSYPEYSADVFDGQNDVIEGAFAATGAGSVRRSLRTWFRSPNAYAYAAFRCAQDSR